MENILCFSCENEINAGSAFCSLCGSKQPLEENNQTTIENAVEITDSKNTDLEKIKKLLNKLNEEIGAKKEKMTSLEFDEFLLKKNKNILSNLKRISELKLTVKDIEVEYKEDFQESIEYFFEEYYDKDDDEFSDVLWLESDWMKISLENADSLPEKIYKISFSDFAIKLSKYYGIVIDKFSPHITFYKYTGVKPKGVNKEDKLTFKVNLIDYTSSGSNYYYNLYDFSDLIKKKKNSNSHIKTTKISPPVNVSVKDRIKEWFK
jgi:hypothetical protein